MSLSQPRPVSAEQVTNGAPRNCGKLSSRRATMSCITPCGDSTKSHLFSTITGARPSSANRLPMPRSCLASGSVASNKSTTTAARPSEASVSSDESFSRLSWTRERRRSPAVSSSSMARPLNDHSTATESRVIPASGPVITRSSPTKRLTSVDFPTLGRPTMARRNFRSPSPIACVLAPPASSSCQAAFPGRASKSANAS